MKLDPRLASGLGLAIVITTALILYFMVTARSIGALGESNEAPSREQIEAYTGVHIPSSVTDVRARLDQVVTKRTVYLRLSIDRSELGSFLRDSPFREPLAAEPISELLKSEFRPDWFTPEKAHQHLTGETTRAAIVIDTTDPMHWVVYMLVRS